VIVDTRVGVTGFSGHPHDHLVRPGERDRPGGSALARCIDLSADVFADKHWGQLPLLTQGRPAEFFADLFDADAVDALVSTHGLRTPFVRMAKNGDVVPGRRFTRSGGAGATIADQIADDKVLDLLADGTTLVLQALHRTWPALVRFGSGLAAEIGHPVQINAYVTPPENQGFAAHYDNHDVFVLQIAGRKQWRIHEPVVDDPLPDQKWDQRRDAVAARAAEPALIDTVLTPGDALYLPRGYLHSASALGELTIHLTVGVHPLTRARVLQQLVASAAHDPRLRGSLPMGVDLADPGVIVPFVREVAEALAEFATGTAESLAPDVAKCLGDALAADTRPEPVAPLRLGAAVASLTASTRLRARAGLRYRLTRDDESCRLAVLDKTIRTAGATAAALEVVLDGRPFTVADLPDIDEPTALDLVRALMRDAVVVPADGVQ
jgi:ribosomal protein L16 Arg81 hydroxylase